MTAPSRGSAEPFGLILSPVGDRAWVTMAGVGQVAELNLVTAKFTRWMVTGAGPDGIGYAR